jgi:hypothetical protein
VGFLGFFLDSRKIFRRLVKEWYLVSLFSHKIKSRNHSKLQMADTIADVPFVLMTTIAFVSTVGFTVSLCFLYRTYTNDTESFHSDEETGTVLPVSRARKKTLQPVPCHPPRQEGHETRHSSLHWLRGSSKALDPDPAPSVPTLSIKYQRSNNTKNSKSTLASLAREFFDYDYQSESPVNPVIQGLYEVPEPKNDTAFGKSKTALIPKTLEKLSIKKLKKKKPLTIDSSSANEASIISVASPFVSPLKIIRSSASEEMTPSPRSVNGETDTRDSASLIIVDESESVAESVKSSSMEFNSTADSSVIELDGVSGGYSYSLDIDITGQSTDTNSNEGKLAGEEILDSQNLDGVFDSFNRIRSMMESEYNGLRGEEETTEEYPVERSVL